MRRLGILTVYNRQGIVHPYLEYYINDLKNILDELIIMVNGSISEDGENILRKYSRRVYTRENIGYDAAAYQEIFNVYIDSQEIKLYDELLITNDTCFGPFESFSTIFKNMQDSDIDYWGFTEEQSPWAHLQSYFLVFRKKTIEHAVAYICSHITNDTTDKWQVVFQFEQGLSSYLWRKGFKRGSYSKLINCHMFTWPYQQVKNGKCPVLKKRCFAKYNEIKPNIIAALKYIKQNFSYDLKYITAVVESEYDIFEDWDMLINSYPYVEDSFEFSLPDATVEEIEEYCRNNKDLLIYGAGRTAQYIYWYYKDIIDDFKGFIVSDNLLNMEQFEGHPVYSISQIIDKRQPILVALNKFNTLEIMTNLKEFYNPMYLWKV